MHCVLNEVMPHYKLLDVIYYSQFYLSFNFF